jgi:hypothetical protein
MKLTSMILVAAALSGASAAAAQTTVYTSLAAFNAAATTTSYAFTFSDTEFTGATYSLGPVSFASSELRSYNDAYGVPYLANFGTVLTITSNFGALGLNLGSYHGSQVVSYNANGVTGLFDAPAPNETNFIGFIGSGPLTITFSNDDELDTVSFLSGTGAIPEPASWILMIAGFGLVGASARRRRAVVAA